jgi:hypothetical protein
LYYLSIPAPKGVTFVTTHEHCPWLHQPSIFADTRTNWYKELRLNAQALCFAEGYHKFGAAENSATFGVLLSYFGDKPGRFCDVFGQFGVCTTSSG